MSLGRAETFDSGKPTVFVIKWTQQASSHLDPAQSSDQMYAHNFKKKGESKKD